MTKYVPRRALSEDGAGPVATAPVGRRRSTQLWTIRPAGT